MTLRLDTQGWLSDIMHCPSPNYNDRPVSAAVNLLVIHNISVPPGCFDGPGIIDLFQNTLNYTLPQYQHLDGLKVSAHFVIRRDGLIIQCVSTYNRAWHAGISCFDGISNCNDYSIGIELEGADTVAFTDEQYQSLLTLTRVLQIVYPLITMDRITGHEQIAPDRKTDPGPCFDWLRFKESLVS